MTNTPYATRRLLPLDGLRGFAALYVIVYHLFPAPSHPANALERIDAGLINFGYSGVDLFFVLSGFLITDILFENRERVRFFVPFYARRILRIWPLYFLLCFALIVVAPAIPTLARLGDFRDETGSPAYYWLFLNNFKYGLPVQRVQFLNVTWSLAIEEQFYLVWPLLIRFLPPRLFFRLSIGIFFFEPVLRNILFHGFGVAGEALYLNTFTHLDGLALGSAIAIAVKDPAAYRTTLSVLAAQLTLTAPLLLGMIVYCSLFPSGALAEPSELAFQPLMVSLGYTLTALACGGILVRSLLGTPSAIVVHPLSRRIGRYSYAMYLLHMPIWFFCAMTLKGAFDAGLLDAGLTRFRAPFLFVVVLTLTYLAAALSWRILEGPLNALKERFPYSGPARAGLATRADSAAVR